MKVFWEQDYPINSLSLNSQGELGLYSLLQILQDTAIGHAQELNLGKAQMNELNMFWVLTRQKLEISFWPRAREVLHTKTWLRVQHDGLLVRDFLIHSSDGKQVGRATTTWLALGQDTRRPVKMDGTKILQGIAQEESTGLTATKISSPANFERLGSFAVRNSDIDGNNHVNNTRYAQWVLDAVPFDLHRTHRVEGYEINFLAETHLGDLIHIEASPGTDWRTFRGVRESDQKVVFISRLKSVSK